MLMSAMHDGYLCAALVFLQTAVAIWQDVEKVWQQTELTTTVAEKFLSHNYHFFFSDIYINLIVTLSSVTMLS